MAISLPTTLWAAQVAAATPLPDARLNTRLQQLLVHFDNKPLDAIPQAMLPEAERPRLIHLMDREGAIYEVLDKIVRLGHGAIIRR